MNGIVDFFCKALQRVGGTRFGRGKLKPSGRAGIAKRRGPRAELVVDGTQALLQSHLELTIGVDVHGIIRGGDGGESVFAKIESGNGGGSIRFPVANAKVAVFFFVDLGAGSGAFEAARPAHGEFVEREIGRVPAMGRPAFASA